MTEFRPSRFEILPTVIKNLLIVNVLFFLAQVTIGSGPNFNMMDLLALHHVKSPLFKPWQLVTHMFLHSPNDIGHLLFNMLSLYMFGAILESLWGPKRFLTFYFICGIGAGILQLASLWYDSQHLLSAFISFKSAPSPEALLSFYKQYGSEVQSQASVDAFNAYLRTPSDYNATNAAVYSLNEEVNRMISYPTLGASGAVAGILAAFVYLFPNTYLYLYFFVPVKAKWFGLVYFGYELYAGISRNVNDNIAHWAHLGGALVGFLLVITWNKKNRKTFY
jgi:membrane associated rhomboid family serine protease